MSDKNFILISDSKEVERDLRGQLDISGEYYNLTRVDYDDAPKYINERKYDRIFAALCQSNLREQANYLVALGKTSTPVTVLEQDKVATKAIAQLQRHSPNLESIAQKDLKNHNNTELLNAFFSYSIEQQRENRIRSDARNEDNTKQWQKISKLETLVENLESDLIKLENHFYGSTTPDGRDNSVLAVAAWVFKNQTKFEQMHLEVRDNARAIADIRADLDAYMKDSKDRKEANWQTKLAVGVAVLGAAASIGAAFVPIAFDLTKTSSSTKAKVELVR